MKKYYIHIILLGVLTILACMDEKEPKDMDEDLTKYPYAPTAIELEYPSYFPQMDIPDDNPMTEEGKELGRHLFYDPILSRDSTVSCASCHLPALSFTDGSALSTGIDGLMTDRSSMSLLNIGFVNTGFFWDGRSPSLENQAGFPIEARNEFHETWPSVLNKIRSSARYPKMFREAFGVEKASAIDREMVAKALAQFQRAMIGYDTKFDRFTRGETVLTDEELYGYSMYIDDDPEIPDAQCDHCHSLPFGTSNAYFNNGLQEAATLEDFKDRGRGKVTGNALENGFFRAPTLRNISYTAPYMHNGSLTTIDEVIDHYASGGKSSPNKDVLLDDITMNEDDKAALKAFLMTLNDEQFLKNEAFSNPFQ